MIFGGYSGDFLKDSYLFNVNTKLMTKTMDMPIECLPYQKGTIFCSETNSILYADHEKKQLLRFDEYGNWSKVQELNIL